MIARYPRQFQSEFFRDKSLAAGRDYKSVTTPPFSFLNLNHLFSEGSDKILLRQSCAISRPCHLNAATPFNVDVIDALIV